MSKQHSSLLHDDSTMQNRKLETYKMQKKIHTHDTLSKCGQSSKVVVVGSDFQILTTLSAKN